MAGKGIVFRFLGPCAVAALLTVLAASRGGSVDGGRVSRMDVPVAALWEGPTYDEASGVLALPAVQVGALTYTGVRLQNIGNYTFELRSAVEQIPPGGAEVTYDEATGIVSIPAVAVDGKTYVNVTLFNTGNYTFSLRSAWQLTSITVSTPTASPKEGDSVQLGAVAWGPDGNVIPGANVAWSTSDPAIATVSASGLVETLATGEVVVTAAINEVSAAQPMTITAITVSVTVTIGAKEVVFRYATDRCDDLDTADHPPRLVRAEDGSLVLAAGNAPNNYLSRGADFGSLKRDCHQPALASADRRTAESYENYEWLWSVYREGSRWHALIHNEFHDAVSSTCLVGNPSPANPCGFVSITQALSIDGGRSFTKPSAPAHVVAPAPSIWVPPAQAGTSIGYGYMSPTNIVRANDGYYYALVGFYPDVPQPDGRSLCAMRTDTLDAPASWRAWDGSGFGLRMTSPYVTGEPAPWCGLLNTEMGTGHLVYSTYLERYLLVTRAQQWIDGRSVCGFFFTLSSDLIHWSRPQLLVEGKLWEWAGCDGGLPGTGVLDDLAILYPSVIDHADATVNFERAGRTAHLYYVRMRDVLDRDVVRVPITFTRLD